MQSAFKKLFYKDQSPVLVWNAPSEASALAKAFGAESHTQVQGEYAFILGFVTSLAKARAAAKAFKKALVPGGTLWLAYPKRTSKRYPKVDLHRDGLHELMEGFGLDGVSLVALDEDWSAMRFKLITKVKSNS